jgi:aryl-alcohol dehydrogenase-like predicted oxidoreductase
MEQPQYTLFEREKVGARVPAARLGRLGTTIWSPLAGT